MKTWPFLLAVSMSVLAFGCNEDVVISLPSGEGGCVDGCASDETCEAGSCVKRCDGDKVRCGQECVDLASLNLASCDACAEGYCDSDGNLGNGCEIDSKVGDAQNCGACGQPCGPGQSCQNGSCKEGCNDNEANCDGLCVDLEAKHMVDCDKCAPSYDNCDDDLSNGCESDLKTSSANCGVCGNACEPGENCVDGVCDALCEPGQAYCNDACIDLASKHLSACDKCADGYGNCDGNTDNGCEVDLASDSNNCGACGNACKAGQVCNAGVCASTCGTNQTYCGSACVDTKTDVNNCGTCGTKCTSTQTCTSGKCVPKCASGQTLCGSTCVTTSSDVNNCGACGTKCTSTQTCTSGKCVPKCASGQTLCGSTCATTSSDVNNCGACGTKCTSTQTCTSGKCVPKCASGQTLCGSACVDTKTNASNCGGCGKACSSGQVCQGGTCVKPYTAHNVMCITDVVLPVRANADNTSAAVEYIGPYNVVTAIAESGAYTKIKIRSAEGWVPTANLMDRHEEAVGFKAVAYAESFLFRCTRDIAAAGGMPNLTNLTGWDDSYYKCGYDMNCANFATACLLNQGLMAKHMLAVADVKSMCDNKVDGYRVISPSQAKPGDLYYWKDSNHSHTELVVGYHNNQIILIGSNNYPGGETPQCLSSCGYATGPGSYQRVAYDKHTVGEGWTVCSKQ